MGTTSKDARARRKRRQRIASSPVTKRSRDEPEAVRSVLGPRSPERIAEIGRIRANESFTEFLAALKRQIVPGSGLRLRPRRDVIMPTMADYWVRQFVSSHPRIDAAATANRERPHPRSAEIKRLIRTRGLSDRAIAADLEIDRGAVARERKRLGYSAAEVRDIRDGVWSNGAE